MCSITVQKKIFLKDWLSLHRSQGAHEVYGGIVVLEFDRGRSQLKPIAISEGRHAQRKLVKFALNLVGEHN